MTATIVLTRSQATHIVRLLDAECLRFEDFEDEEIRVFIDNLLSVILAQLEAQGVTVSDHLSRPGPPPDHWPSLDEPLAP